MTTAGVTEFLETPARQAASLEETAHRPWAPPDEPWTAAQTWELLAFLHWRVEAAALEQLVPDGLELETHDGSAWLGVTPFRLTGLRLRGLPPLPGVSSFPELNVRTYVTRGDRPGIWFFSLEAGSRLAVEAGRRLYRLPYRHARMSIARAGGWVRYDSARAGAVFSARYRGSGAPSGAAAGSLEHFLTERYCLYAGDGERLYRAEIHHRPWLLEPGEVETELNTLAPPGVELEAEPLVHFSARQDVVVWAPQALD